MNNNITEKYCSFEVSNLLKDKGFDSDANWQFEALEYIRKNCNARYAITWNFCSINVTKGRLIKPVCRVEMEPISSIFEALYQFSQFIKQVK